MGRPYENVYIGAFIYLLGYMSSAKYSGATSSAAIELYQHTRDGEKLIGDLLTSIGGKSIILEFKRDAGSVKSELKKRSRAALFAALRADENGQFAEISRRCHFIAFPTRSDRLENIQNLNFYPYATLVNDTYIGDALADSEFCDRYLDLGSFDCGVDHNDFQYYIGKLAKLNRATCGGLAISLGETGLRALVQFDDVRELQQSLARAEQRAERALQLSRGRALEHGRG